MKSTPHHEKLFDEICGKLAELSSNALHTEDDMQTEAWTHRIEKMQSQLKKSQDELKSVQENLQAKIGSIETMAFVDADLQSEIERTTNQLDSERQTNSKLNSDLAKSLELNLKLQFEIEEIRAKANQLLAEEKKHNQYLSDKNKSLSHELELSQALCQDTRLELGKARDKFQNDQNTWGSEKSQMQSEILELSNMLDQRQVEHNGLQDLLTQKDQELEQVSDSLLQFEAQAQQQQEMMKNLTAVAEKKIIELKMGLDKKTFEAQDYYSHLQQVHSQVAVLKQENSALKDYIGKLTALHQTAQT
jgi:chromosome segregation ATPase